MLSSSSSSSSSSRMRSLSRTPPLVAPAPSLVGDDPFANLAASDSEHSLVVSQPRAARPRSSGHSQVRPAHTKPAFAPRPSLPSLHALAQMNTAVPGRRVRKGTPGARLPHEPWDMDLSAAPNLLTRSGAGPSRLHDDRSTQPSASVHDTSPQTDLVPLSTTAETCFASREIAVDSPSLSDETSSPRSLSGDDAETDSLPSLSYTVSEPSSSTLSRPSSIASSVRLQGPMVINSSGDHPSLTLDAGDAVAEEDPLSYHSDFDYYTRSPSDVSDSDSDLDPHPGGKPPSLDAGVTPFSSVYDPLVEFEPGTSADTMRRASRPRERIQSDFHLLASPDLHSPWDGYGWRGQPSEHERQSAREDEPKGRDATRPNRRPSGGQPSGPGGNDNNVVKARAPGSSDSSTTDYTSSSDDADAITLYYSLDGMSNGSPSRAHSRTHSRYSKAGGGSDDDVPLAQRVPTALSAQKSIRKQLHDERQQRKLERARSSRAEKEQPIPSHPTESLRALGSPARFRKRSVSAAPAPVPSSRIPSIEAFPAEDLTRKLANLQTSFRAPPPPALMTGDVPPRAPGYSAGVSRSSSRGRRTDYTTYAKTLRVPEASSQDRPLKSMRSFHRPDGRHSETQRTHIEQTPGLRLGRSATSAASSRTTRNGRDAGSAGHEQYAKSNRVSEDSRIPSTSVPRPTIDRDNDTVVQRGLQRPPVPPLPLSDSTPPQHVSRGPVIQQRIFIGDMQRFNLVEITLSTNAGDVIDTVAGQGMLDRPGSWMLFELAQDYGMERPIRNYELLADVSASWNKDKLLNAFVIKQTPLAPLLSRSAIPTSSPIHRGWVEWESKRGKWSKRWMELREHGLWLSKRDTGKDEIFLCSLSNFDAYFITRRHKSPKAFMFAIKSTDHPSLFENVADYLHVFSCNPKDGEKWMEVILVARSYVLYQERHVLFAKAGEALSQAKPLARSRTRKQSVSNRPAQPLVNVPPPFSQSTTATIAFEPGSLLAKRKGDMQP